MPLYGPSTPRGTYLDLGPGVFSGGCDRDCERRACGNAESLARSRGDSDFTDFACRRVARCDASAIKIRKLLTASGLFFEHSLRGIFIDKFSGLRSPILILNQFSANLASRDNFFHGTVSLASHHGQATRGFPG